jgi:hypothetical protein
MNFTRSFTSINENDLIKFENDKCLNLPKEYRNFLLKYNGGYWPEKNSFNFINRADGSDIQYFYGVNLPNKEKESSTSLDYQAEASGEDFPSKYLAIANDSGGNQILLNLINGKVYFWDHEIMFDEEEGEDAETFEDNITLISNSFKDFIDGLYDYILDDKD